MKKPATTDEMHTPRPDADAGEGASLRSRFDRLSQKSRLPARVATLITREIAEGRLKPGDRLPTEVNLVRSLGVSRNVLREAVARLQSEGILEARHGVGVFVTGEAQSAPLVHGHPADDDGADFDELFELRMMIEPRAAALAARRRSDRHLDALRNAHDRMKAAGGWDKATVDADLAFHHAIAAASGNGYVVGIYSRIFGHMRESIVVTRASTDTERDAQTACVEHQRILDAIAEQDSAGAEEAMKQHLLSAETRLTRHGAIPADAEND